MYTHTPCSYSILCVIYFCGKESILNITQTLEIQIFNMKLDQFTAILMCVLKDNNYVYVHTYEHTHTGIAMYIT